MDVDNARGKERKRKSLEKSLRACRGTGDVEGDGDRS
jgi:hypothetical protein